MWQLAAGAGLGALGGLLGRPKKPPRYVPTMGWYEGAYGHDNDKGAMYDAKGRQQWGQDGEGLQYGFEDFGKLRGYLGSAMEGGPIWSDDEKAAMLNPGRAAIAGSAAAARRRAQERGTSLGIAPRSGMLEDTLAGIDRAEMAGNRDAYAKLLSQEAAMRIQRQQAAAAQLQALLSGDLAHRTGERQMQYQAQAARSQTPKWWESMLSGAANGALGSLGMVGGGKGGGGQAAPTYAGWTGTGADYPFDGAGFNFDGEWWADQQVYP